LQPSLILFDPFATEQDKIFYLFSLEIEAVCEDDATKKYESRAGALLAGRGSRAQTLRAEHGSHKIFMLTGVWDPSFSSENKIQNRTMWPDCLRVIRRRYSIESSGG